MPVAGTPSHRIPAAGYSARSFHRLPSASRRTRRESQFEQPHSESRGGAPVIGPGRVPGRVTG
eukprot:266718-Hanusia_phi.AAC.2